MPTITFFLFFFNDPAPTEIYTLSLHDALPISVRARRPATRDLAGAGLERAARQAPRRRAALRGDRKSTRLNSSHSSISYAVFCLKKKKETQGDYRAETEQYQHCHAGRTPICS